MHGVVSTLESCVKPTLFAPSDAFANAGATAVNPISMYRRARDANTISKSTATFLSSLENRRRRNGRKNHRNKETIVATIVATLSSPFRAFFTAIIADTIV